MKDLSNENFINKTVCAFAGGNHKNYIEVRNELYRRLSAGEEAVRSLRQETARLNAADNRISELEKQLAIACHVKTDDKVSFDWAVLTKIDELEKENSEMARQLAEPAEWQIEKDRLEKEVERLKAEVVAYKLAHSVLVERVAAGQQMAVEKYNELISHVETKHPNETRHETAIRYIIEKERKADQQSKEAGK
jgi:hypothetical protein